MPGVRAACGGAKGELGYSNVGPAASGGSNQRSSGNPSLSVGTPAPWLDIEPSALGSISKSGFRSTPHWTQEVNIAYDDGTAQTFVTLY
jgi:hypothetical protein